MNLKFFVAFLFVAIFLWIRMDIVHFKNQLHHVKSCRETFLNIYQENYANYLENKNVDSVYLAFLLLSYTPNYVQHIASNDKNYNIYTFNNKKVIHLNLISSDTSCVFSFPRDLNYLFEKLESRKRQMLHFKNQSEFI